MGGISASFVVPVYNSARYLDRCLGSILSQTCGDIEVICIDNASRDNSREVLERIARDDGRVVVLEETRAGVSCARNAGMRRASGRYLLFVDADDAVEPTLVERAIGAAEEHQADMVIFSLDECYDNPRVSLPWARCPAERCYRETFSMADLEIPAPFAVTPNVWRILYRRDFVERHHLTYPEELRSSEDLVFVYEAMFQAKRIILLPDVLYHYRRDNAESLTRGDRDAAGIAALDILFGRLSGGWRQEPWFHRQFVNIMLDTFQYQLSTSVTPQEFSRLFTGYQDRWSVYAEEHEALIDGAYRSFFDQMALGDVLEYLFGLYHARANDDERRRVFAEADRLAREDAERRAGEATAELDRILGSRSWRLARAIAGVVGKFRR